MVLVVDFYFLAAFAIGHSLKILEAERNEAKIFSPQERSGRGDFTSVPKAQSEIAKLSDIASSQCAATSHRDVASVAGRLGQPKARVAA